MKDKKMGPPPEPSEAGPVGRGGRNEAGAVPAATRQGRSRAEFLPTICRYCGGVIKLIPAKMVFGGFEMDQCQKVIELCGKMENKEAA